MTHHARMTSLGELVAALPYALGFEVHESLVVVGRKDGLADGYARMDMLDVVHGGVAQIIRPFVRRDVDDVILIGVESTRGQAHEALTLAAACADRHQLTVAASIVVRERHWWPLSDVSGPGTAVPAPSEVSACVALIVEGRAPLASRDQVRSLVAPDGVRSDLVAQELAALRGTRPARLRTRSATGWAWVAAPRGPWHVPSPPALVAAMGHASLDRQWRDAVLIWLTPRSAPLETIPGPLTKVLRQRLPAREDIPAPRDLITRFAALSACMPDEVPDVAAEICAMTSSVAWWAGDGVLAREAADRALELLPGHVLAGLVGRLATMGAAPDVATAAPQGAAIRRSSA